ncbi:hypothetical protein D5086_027179 [Populus alba]|uniref:Uncharacterized protein n=1 Tax=Populus alba TaxID=43335 RepID=A0ACC4B3Y5_POPAL
MPFLMRRSLRFLTRMMMLRRELLRKKLGFLMNLSGRSNGCVEAKMARPISLRNPAGNMSSQNCFSWLFGGAEHSSQSDLSDMDGTLLSDSLLSWKQRPYKGKEPLLPEAAPQEKDLI